MVLFDDVIVRLEASNLVVIFLKSIESRRLMLSSDEVEPNIQLMYNTYDDYNMTDLSLTSIEQFIDRFASFRHFLHRYIDPSE